MFVPCFVVQCVVSFLVLQEESAYCFTLSSWCLVSLRICLSYWVVYSSGSLLSASNDWTLVCNYLALSPLRF